MKWFIASDIHGSAYFAEKMIEAYKREQADKMLLLGDILYHGPGNDLPRDYTPKKVIPLLNKEKEHILCVRGNCDAEVDQMVLDFPCLADYSQLMVDGKVFHLSHGHHQNPESLPKLPAGSVFLYGHTHVKFDKVVGGIRCLNPGSVSIPKDGSNSCLVYEDGDFRFVTLEA